jgi:hypothetical protein
MPTVAAALVVCAVVTPVGAGSHLRGWRDGPVGGLLTDVEYRQFGQLKTDDERRAFIDRLLARARNGFRRGAELVPHDVRAALRGRAEALHLRRTGRLAHGSRSRVPCAG